MDTSYKASIDFDTTARIDVVTGGAAFQLLSDTDFQSRWDKLYESCPWGTVFQRREFVSQWYQVYQSEFLPIIVTSTSQGSLVGLLTMALNLSGVVPAKLECSRGNIIGAGHYEAEYQVWLAETSGSDLFVVQALQEISRQFPKCNVHFRFLPAATPMQWVKQNRLRRDVIVQELKRPLMDLKNPELAKAFRKAEFRNKLNRLKRLGELQFLHIKDADTFSNILQDATIQFDFRQGAMFNKNQFRESPLKSIFLKAMFEQDLLHVTALKVNEDVLSVIMAVVGNGWVHLGGINVHTPFHAKYYSPGFVHFLMLGQFLAEEGVAIFDLTPGGDAYKERLATRHDYVYELIIPGNAGYTIKRRLKKVFHDQLIRFGIRPMSAELTLKKGMYLLKNKVKRLKNFDSEELATIMSQSGKTNVYELSLLQISSGTPLAVRQNNLNDLLNYEQGGSWLTRWEFLEQAMRRYETGEQSYSWSEQGRLLGCVWLAAPGPGAGPLPGQIPEDAVVLQGLYYHAAGQEHLRTFLAAVVETVVAAGKRPGVLLADARTIARLKAAAGKTIVAEELSKAES
ncbi:MAG TPA: GNAT family N-acetyltransferase [Pontibacter sp.]